MRARLAAETGLRYAAAQADRAAAALALQTGDASGAAERALESAAATLDALGGAGPGRPGARARRPRARREPATVAARSPSSSALPRRSRPAARRAGATWSSRSCASSAGPSTGAAARAASRRSRARELEIARLVVDRQTNTQIAAALFLSKKTVETHLRNIFGKVGVSSRVELARAVERADRGG